jgi:hypothetical protein
MCEGQCHHQRPCMQHPRHRLAKGPHSSRAPSKATVQDTLGTAVVHYTILDKTTPLAHLHSRSCHSHRATGESPEMTPMQVVPKHSAKPASPLQLHTSKPGLPIAAASFVLPLPQHPCVLYNSPQPQPLNNKAAELPLPQKTPHLRYGCCCCHNSHCVLQHQPSEKAADASATKDASASAAAAVATAYAVSAASALYQSC